MEAVTLPLIQTKKRRAAARRRPAQSGTGRTATARSKQAARTPPRSARRSTGGAATRRTAAQTRSAARTRTAAQTRSASRARQSRRKKQEPFSPFRLGVLMEMGRPFDLPLLLITIALLVTGLISLLSASYPQAYYSTVELPFGSMTYFIKQAGFCVLGLAAMFCVSCIDYRKYRRWVGWVYVGCAFLLVLVLTPLGTTINMARRWLFGFQPSELAKLAIILLFAYYASEFPKRVRSLRGLVPCFALLLVYIGLLALEPHMSAAMIMCIIGVAILFVAGMKIWYFIVVGALGSVGAVAAYLLLGHVRTRVSIWLHPFTDATGDGWQACQSLIAIGSGGIFGLGLGQSRQKFLYLPEPMNDFIFSVICEEMGFIGAGLVMALFAYFIYRGYTIGRRAGDTFGALIATGITTQLAFQILLNLAVVSGLFPVTGASLPFFSYGGTALVMQLVEVGILLNISRHIPASRRD